MTPAALLAIIALAETQNHIPSGLLVSICKVESNLNPFAVVEQDGISERASYGLCMVQLRTARQFRPGTSASQLYNPATNAQIGAAYLKWNYRRYHSWVGATIAYNKGSWSGGMTNRYWRKIEKEWRINVGNKGTAAVIGGGYPLGSENSTRSSQGVRSSYAGTN